MLSRVHRTPAIRVGHVMAAAIALVASFGFVIANAPSAGAVVTTTTCTDPEVMPADFQDLVADAAPIINASLTVNLSAVPNPVTVGNSFDTDAVNSSVDIAADDPLIALAINAGVTEISATSTVPVAVALNGAATGATTLGLTQDAAADQIADGYSSPLTGGDTWDATNPGTVTYSVADTQYPMTLSLNVLMQDVEATYTCTATTAKILDVEVVDVPPPIVVSAGDDEATTEQDTPVDINVTLNDFAQNAQLNSTPQNVSDPANGTTEVIGGQIRYTPDAGFLGEDTFTYDICIIPQQGQEPACDPATVTVTVVEPQPAPTTTTTVPGSTTTTTTPDQTTTTTAPDETTTTTTPDSSTTTTPDESTTTTAPDSSTTTSPDSTATTTANTPSSSVSPTTSGSQLPVTGSGGLSTSLLIAAGALAVGVALLAMARRAGLAN